MNTVNFDKLEEEFILRLEEEMRTKKQDEIRFQTMHDPKITYEQYSELLKGAHLKSVQRQERAEINRRYKQTVLYTDYDNENAKLSVNDT